MTITTDWRNGSWRGWLGAVMVVLYGLTLQAETQAPKPGPEHKKMEVWIGTWKYEGDYKASPIGPATKFSGQQTGRWILNGFFVEWKGREKGQFGDVEFTEIDSYDPVTSSYPSHGYQNDGDTWSGTGTVNGNMWTGSGTMIHKGTEYKTRSEGTFSADGKTYTWKGEISTDGKTWSPWMEGKMTK